MIVPASFRHFLVTIVTHPDTTGIIRCKSFEPEVTVVGGCTGFTGCRHIIELCIGCSTLCDNILHGVGKKCCSCIFDHSVAFRIGVVDQDITIMIQYLCVQGWFVIYTAVCNGCIGCCQFIVVNTMGNTTKSKRLYSIIFGKCGKTKFLAVFKTKIDTNLIQCLYRNDVHGLFDRLTVCYGTFIVIAPPVMNLMMFQVVLIVVFFINFGGSKCKICAVQCRSVYGKNLECRTCVTGRTLVCAVQSTVGCLLSTATDKSFDLPCFLIDDGK